MDEDPCKDGHDTELMFVDEEGKEHWHCKNCVNGGEIR